MPREAFSLAWRRLIQAASCNVLSCWQAAKAHPSERKPLPGFFDGILELDRGVPIEFFQFPNLSIAVGSASSSMKYLAATTEAKVITCLKCLATHQHPISDSGSLIKTMFDRDSRFIWLESPEDLIRLSEGI